MHLLATTGEAALIGAALAIALGLVEVVKIMAKRRASGNGKPAVGEQTMRINVAEEVKDVLERKEERSVLYQIRDTGRQSLALQREMIEIWKQKECPIRRSG